VDWTSDWIDTAESLVRDEFEHSYKTTTNSDSKSNGGGASDDVANTVSALKDKQAH